MRDGKEIIFTKHAKQRCYERHLGELTDLLEWFKESLRFDENSWCASYFYKDITYIVKEQPDKFIIVTLYQQHP